MIDDIGWAYTAGVSAEEGIHNCALDFAGVHEGELLSELVEHSLDGAQCVEADDDGLVEHEGNRCVDIGGVAADQVGDDGEAGGGRGGPGELAARLGELFGGAGIEEFTTGDLKCTVEALPKFEQRPLLQAEVGPALERVDAL